MMEVSSFKRLRRLRVENARDRNGAEGKALPPNLSAGCGFSKQTLAGTGGKEDDAPLPAVRCAQ